MRTKAIKPTALGSVSLGATFVYRTAEIISPEYANTHKLPFEGKIMTVVEFNPRYVNQVVVRDPNGYECLVREMERDSTDSFRT